MLTQDEIFDILTESLIVRVAALSEDAPLNECFFSIAGKSEAAEAIAARLTLVHRMSEFVTLSSHRDIYTVLDPDGRARNVWMKGNGGSKCWIPLDGCQEGCSDSKDRTTCDHVQAVKLYLARQEAKK